MMITSSVGGAFIDGAAALGPVGRLAAPLVSAELLVELVGESGNASRGSVDEYDLACPFSFSGLVAITLPFLCGIPDGPANIFVGLGDAAPGLSGDGVILGLCGSCRSSLCGVGLF